MALTPCKEDFCGRIAEYRGRCKVHNQELGRSSRETARVTRRSGRMYLLKRWDVLRRRRLHDEPLCRECGAVATDVDHVVPVEQGGEPWDLENTQSLCASCHGRKTRREQVAYSMKGGARAAG